MRCSISPLVNVGHNLDTVDDQSLLHWSFRVPTATGRSTLLVCRKTLGGCAATILGSSPLLWRKPPLSVLAEWHSGIAFNCRALCRTRARNVIRPCRISNKRPSLPLLPGLTVWSTVRPECTGHQSSWPSSLLGSSAPTSTRSTRDWKG